MVLSLLFRCPWNFSCHLCIEDLMLQGVNKDENAEEFHQLKNASLHTHSLTERVSQEEVMAGSITQKGATGHTSLCRPLPPVSAPTHERQGSRMRKLCPKGLWAARGQIMTGFPCKCALTGPIQKGILDWNEPT